MVFHGAGAEQSLVLGDNLSRFQSEREAIAGYSLTAIQLQGQFSGIKVEFARALLIKSFT